MKKRIMSALVVFLSLIGTSSMINAQYNWAEPALSLSLQDQLPSTYIKKIIQDEFGFTWIASYTGISRYDGVETFTLQDSILPTQTFQDIIYDQKRRLLWIAAFDGIFSYHVISGKLQKYGSPEDKVTNYVICIFLDDQDRLWVGGRKGFGYLNLTDFSTVALDLPYSDINVRIPSITAMSASAKNSDIIWLGTQHGLIKYNHQSGDFNDLSALIDKESFGVHEIQYDETKNSLFLGLIRQKKYDDRAKVLQFDINGKEETESIISGTDWESRQIQHLNDSILLLSTSSKIIAYNKLSQTLNYNFQEAAEVGNNKLEYIDPMGRIWVSNESHIHVFTSNSTKAQSSFYTSSHPNWIHVASDIYVDEDEQHIHLTEYDGEGLYTLNLNTLEWEINPILDDEGKIKKAKLSYGGRLADNSIAVIGYSGMYILKNSQLESVELDLPQGRQLSGAFIDSNDIWSLDKIGVYKYNIVSKEFTDFSHKARSCKETPGTTEIHRDNVGNIWIGGLCSHFHYYDKKNASLTELNFNSPDYNSYIVNFVDYGGDLWAISHDLIVGKINVLAPSSGIHTTIDIKRLIESNQINFVNTIPFVPEACNDGMIDNNGYLWFIIPKGLLKFDPELLTLELFDKEDGLIVNDPDLRVFVADNLKKLKDGRMIYSVRKGVSIFDPNTITNLQSSQTPYIESIRINDKYLKSDSTALFKKSYSLKPTENFIGIDFSSIDYTSENRMYRFKLNGLDENWRDPEDRRHVYYTNLEGDNYQFELQLADNSGNWNEESVKLDFDIAMFWYKTIWAKLLAGGFLLFTIFSFYYYRLRRAIEEEKTKTLYEKNLSKLKMQALTSQMNPHFLYNSLNSIQHFIIKNKTKEAVSYLDRFSRLVRLILQNSRSNKVPLSDELEALNLYLELESIRFKDKFEYDILIDENINTNDIEIAPMLIQPFVENAILHGLRGKKEKGLITVNIEQQNEQLICTVEDNGIGRKAALATKDKHKRKSKSMGMTITQGRINSINQDLDSNASMEVIDLVNTEEQGIGTRVVIKLPV